MSIDEVVDGLEMFKERLTGEVLSAFQSRGRAYGRDRFNTWRKKFSKFLDANLPGESATLNAKLTHMAFSVRRGENDAQRFWRQDGEIMLSYIDSLVLDVKNDEYDFPEDQETETVEFAPEQKSKNSVFIVHGHDGEAKERTARFIEKLGFKAIVLHEQVSRGMTIIEKIEKFSNDVSFGIVLYTPDDLGNVKDSAESGELKSRARQNVVFEHGYLIGKLGRHNVVPLVQGAVELPNDISGMVYINDQDWQMDIAKEMKSAGYEIDFNMLFE